MKYIITALLIVLAFSGYMALTMEYRSNSAQAECQPVLEVHFEEIAPEAPAEITREPPPRKKLKTARLIMNIRTRKQFGQKQPEDLPDYSSNNSIETK